MASPDIYGIEGPVWQVLKACEEGLDTDRHLASALRVAELVETDPVMVPASAHLLAIARSP